jgi:hypothetical protein
MCCLLNRYDDSPLIEPLKPISRGEIIPFLLKQRSLEEAFYWLNRLPLARFRNFDLVLFEGQGMLHYTHIDRLGTVRRLAGSNHMFTSSSWNTDEVIKWRRQRFNKFMTRSCRTAPASSPVLSEFHLDDQHDSRYAVLMSRSETHTKSISQIIIKREHIDVYYLDSTVLAQKQTHHFMTNPYACAHKQTLTRCAVRQTMRAESATGNRWLTDCMLIPNHNN